MVPNYHHLYFNRANVQNDRRRGRRFSRSVPPADPAKHALTLDRALVASQQQAPERGYDERRLLKLTVDKSLQVDKLGTFGDIEVVSQERDTVTVLFATEAALGEFRSRLASIQHGQRATRQDVIFAIHGIDGWTSEDRIGHALRSDWPTTESFRVDVELWALESPQENGRLREYFEERLRSEGIQVLDQVRNPLPLYRVVVDHRGLNVLLTRFPHLKIGNFSS